MALWGGGLALDDDVQHLLLGSSTKVLRGDGLRAEVKGSSWPPAVSDRRHL